MMGARQRYQDVSTIAAANSQALTQQATIE
jgi:hypothetical protein